MGVYEYPIQITNSDLKNERNIDLMKEYGQPILKSFLADVHSTVYEGAIYATGARSIKERIIQRHRDEVEGAIKRALLIQATYMHDEGNVGTASGITITADGQKAVVPKNELRSKNLCIAAIDALKSCACPILYSGEEYE